MRVLTTIHELGVNGASLEVPEIAARLTQRGDSIDVLVPEGVTGPLQGRIEAAGGRILRSASKGGYDVALVPSILNAQMVLNLAPHMPVVWHVHEAESGLNWLNRTEQAVPAFTAASHIVFGHAHCREVLFAPYLRHHAPHATSIIPSAADCPPLGTPLTRAGEKDGRSVLFVGTPYNRKRPVDLFTAFLVHCGDAPPLRIVGDASMLDPEARPLVERAPERFEFLGVLDWPALMAEYQRASILSLPSTSEVFPRVALEAALHGCALVLSDLPVHRGTWRDGATALIHGVMDWRGLGLALRRLMDNPDDRMRLAEAGRAMALNYPKDQALDRMIMIMERLARARTLLG